MSHHALLQGDHVLHILTERSRDDARQAADVSVSQNDENLIGTHSTYHPLHGVLALYHRQTAFSGPLHVPLCRDTCVHTHVASVSAVQATLDQ